MYPSISVLLSYITYIIYPYLIEIIIKFKNVSTLGGRWKRKGTGKPIYKHVVLAERLAPLMCKEEDDVRNEVTTGTDIGGNNRICLSNE